MIFFGPAEVLHGIVCCVALLYILNFVQQVYNLQVTFSSVHKLCKLIVVCPLRCGKSCIEYPNVQGCDARMLDSCSAAWNKNMYFKLKEGEKY